MSTDYQSIPHANVFGLGRHSHGVILDEFNVSRLSAAVQGVHAIAAVLHQRELDAETLNADGVSFGPGVALGLLAALATCNEFVQNVVEGCSAGVAVANYGTPEYEHLQAVRARVMDASVGDAA